MSVPPYPTIPLAFERITLEESRRRVLAFRDHIRRRRTARDFAADDVPSDIVDAAIEAAGSAPSGANRQPWRFVVVPAKARAGLRPHPGRISGPRGAGAGRPQEAPRRDPSRRLITAVMAPSAWRRMWRSTRSWMRWMMASDQSLQ